MVTASTDELLRELWRRFLPVVEERVAAIEWYAAELSAGRGLESGRVVAARAAHNLAGVLGTYGRREASSVAARIESLLVAVDAPGPSAVEPSAAAAATAGSFVDAVLLSRLAVDLRAEVMS